MNQFPVSTSAQSVFARSHTCIVLLLLALTVANAESTFRISTFDTRLRNAYYPSPVKAGNPHYLTIAPGYISGPYTYRGGRALEIYQRDEQGVQQLLAIATIPPDISQPLVMLYAGPVPGPNETSLPYGAAVFEDSLQSAPPGSVHFVNASPYVLAASIQGNRPTILNPGRESMQQFTGQQQDSIYSALNLAYQSPQDGQWHRFGGSSLPLSDDIRYYLFLRPRLLDNNALAPRPILLIPDRARLLKPETVSRN